MTCHHKTKGHSNKKQSSPTELQDPPIKYYGIKSTYVPSKSEEIYHKNVHHNLTARLDYLIVTDHQLSQTVTAAYRDIAACLLGGQNLFLQVTFRVDRQKF